MKKNILTIAAFGLVLGATACAPAAEDAAAIEETAETTEAEAPADEGATAVEEGEATTEAAGSMEPGGNPVDR